MFTLFCQWVNTNLLFGIIFDRLQVGFAQILLKIQSNSCKFMVSDCLLLLLFAVIFAARSICCDWHLPFASGCKLQLAQLPFSVCQTALIQLMKT